MTKKKTIRENQPPQGNIKNIIPDRFTYDADGIDNFLQKVFHSEFDEDEEILAWITKGSPAGFPITEDELIRRVSKTMGPRAMYFSTATAHRNPEKELRNQKKVFKRFHVLVLDDIGDKVELDKLPEGFTPTYIIETSPGSFHYGYVLKEPITVLEQAEALVQLVYEGGFSDKGGKMANKQVRLPDGINGKEGEKQNFHVKLITMDGPYWTPQEILETLDLGVTWDEVITNADGVFKRRAAKGIGASAWSPLKSQLSALDGVVDPVAEWLYDEDRVKQETNEWLTIKCPWSDMHSEDTADWASYSPLGWGGSEWRDNRGFNCFHEHCKSRSSGDFLEYIAKDGGPNEPVIVRAAHLLSTYVYDRILNGVWEVKGVHQPIYVPMEGFKGSHTDKAWVPQYDGKMKLVAETSMFMNAKNRVIVDGQIYDPTTIEKLVNDNYGKYWVNMYTQPEWGDGEYNKKHIKTFKRFISYLIPDETDREFYLDWLAAKCQDMAFRGPAILMIAPSQGTGRTTLGNMVGELLGKENVEKVPFERLAGGQGGSQYNDWIVKPMIITDETAAIGDDQKKWSVYERLKELFDTTPELVRVNPKFGKQRFQTTYSSFMLFSNHEDAMQIADNDRRIYVMNNAPIPEKPEYFVKLHEWLETDWAQAVWRWLRQRDVNVAELLKPPERNKAKDEMLVASKQPIDIVFETVLANWPSKLVAQFQVTDLIDSSPFKHRLRIDDLSKRNKIYAYKMQSNTLKVDTNKIRIAGNSRRIKCIKSQLGDDEFLVKTKVETHIAHDYIIEKLTDKQRKAIIVAVEDALDAHDF